MQAPTRAQALRFWLKLGCIGFGGPAGQIARMHRELVDERRWIGERRLQHALSYCMLLPGPEAQQLATYLGWLMHGRAMGIAAGLLFILPAWLLMALLGWAYMAHGHQPALQAVLAGLKPAVVAIVLHAAWRLGRRQLSHPLWLGIAAAACAGLVLGLPFPLLLLLAAAIGVLASRWLPAAFASSPPAGPAGAPRAAWLDDESPMPPQVLSARPTGVLSIGLLLWALPMGLLAGWQGLQGFFPTLGLFFTQAALVTFGGAYAVLPYVAQATVLQHGWLSAGQLMDGLALGETTPGPLIIVLVFIGFVAGWQGPAGLDPLPAALLAAGLVGYFTFLPSFVLILVGAPYVERSRHLPGVTAPLRAISAAVVGVILQLGLFLAAHALWPSGRVDGFACALALGCAIALIGLRRGVVEVIVAAAAIGLLRAAL